MVSEPEPREPEPRDPDLRARVEALVEQAGYSSDDPLVVGVRLAGAPPAFVAGGTTLDGVPLGPGTVVYAASLAKQLAAACVALLARQGRLSLESDLSTWLPELPGWAGRARVRHLLSHTGGLPEVWSWEELASAGRDRSTGAVVEALTAAPSPDAAPGAEHHYSNAGYVCLGLVVARAAGRPFAEVARELVLHPLRLSARWWDGPAPHPPGAAPLDPPHPAPLSLGDGGLWASAADLLRWNRAMHDDVLGVADLVQAPGRLDDGTPLDYAWGLGVREHAGRRLYRHGGRWAGLNAQLFRLGDDGSGGVVLALDDDEDRVLALTGLLLGVAAG